MKNKGLLITAIIFFLIVNTLYFWKGKLGIWAFPTFAVLALVFIVLTVLLFRQIYLLIKERFTNKSRLFSAGILFSVLALVLYKPMGIIDFDSLEGEDVLVAQREGAANCMTTFKLKDNLTFKERSVCFGLEEQTGTYHLSNDTIYFSYSTQDKDVKKYEFAIVEEFGNNTPKSFYLKLFGTKNDSIDMSLSIKELKLKIKPFIKAELQQEEYTKWVGNITTTVSKDIEKLGKLLDFKTYKPIKVKFKYVYIDNSGSNDRLSVPGPSDYSLEALLYFDSLTFRKLNDFEKNIDYYHYPNYNKSDFKFDWLDKETLNELENSNPNYHGHPDFFFGSSHGKSWYLNKKILIQKSSN